MVYVAIVRKNLHNNTEHVCTYNNWEHIISSLCWNTNHNARRFFLQDMKHDYQFSIYKMNTLPSPQVAYCILHNLYVILRIHMNIEINIHINYIRKK